MLPLFIAPLEHDEALSIRLKPGSEVAMGCGWRSYRVHKATGNFPDCFIILYHSSSFYIKKMVPFIILHHFGLEEVSQKRGKTKKAPHLSSFILIKPH